MRIQPFAGAAVLAALVLLPAAARAQDSVRRASLIAGATTSAPECARADPGTSATLDTQLQYWQSLQACLAAHAASQRVAATSLSAPAQANVALAALDAQEQQRQIEAVVAEVQNQKDFLGWSWGVGFGVGISGDERIEEAAIVDGVVHSSKETTNQARVFLEYHWFPERWQNTLGRKEDGKIVRAQGPFVAVASRDDKVLSGVGLGWSIGFRDANKSAGFGISIGAMLDNDVTTLADGFEDGKPPPNGETAIRTESKSRISYILFFTRSF